MSEKIYKNTLTIQGVTINQYYSREDNDALFPFIFDILAGVLSSNMQHLVNREAFQ